MKSKELWKREGCGVGKITAWEKKAGGAQGVLSHPIPHPQEPQNSLFFTQEQREVGAAVNISISMVMPLGNYVCLSKTSKKITLCKSGLFLNFFFFLFCFTILRNFPGFSFFSGRVVRGGKMDEQGKKRKKR